MRQTRQDVGAKANAEADAVGHAEVVQNVFDLKHYVHFFMQERVSSVCVSQRRDLLRILQILMINHILLLSLDTFLIKRKSHALLHGVILETDIRSSCTIAI